MSERKLRKLNPQKLIKIPVIGENDLFQKDCSLCCKIVSGYKKIRSSKILVEITLFRNYEDFTEKCEKGPFILFTSSQTSRPTIDTPYPHMIISEDFAVYKSSTINGVFTKPTAKSILETLLRCTILSMKSEF